jgi:hypothetical protein
MFVTAKRARPRAGWLEIADLLIGTVQNSPEGRMPGSKS